MSVPFFRPAAAAALLALAAGPAAAHTGSAPIVDFVSGALHLLSGFDHVLVMVGVGVLAVLIARRALV
jgi:urease accessory protein